MRDRDDLRERLCDQAEFLGACGAEFAVLRPGEPAPAVPPAAERPAAASPRSAPVVRSVTPAPAPEPPRVAEGSGGGAPGGDPGEFDRLEERVRACRACPLSRLRSHAVPGEGNRTAELMFVGEAPGADEDEQGRPFVGRAGQMLRRIIAAMTFREDEVFIANILKCRPPENRKPNRDEVAACTPFLLEQIRMVAPRVIVALGRTPLEFFVPGADPRRSMTDLRGRWYEFRGIPVMPTYHPSYLIRNPVDRGPKKIVWDDMKLVMERLGRKVPERSSP